MRQDIWISEHRWIEEKASNAKGETHDYAILIYQTLDNECQSSSKFFIHGDKYIHRTS